MTKKIDTSKTPQTSTITDLYFRTLANTAYSCGRNLTSATPSKAFLLIKLGPPSSQIPLEQDPGAGSPSEGSSLRETHGRSNSQPWQRAHPGSPVKGLLCPVWLGCPGQVCQKSFMAAGSATTPPPPIFGILRHTSCISREVRSRANTADLTQSQENALRTDIP